MDTHYNERAPGTHLAGGWVGPRGVSNKLIKIIPVPTDPVVAVSSK
jgi:hypothetical protein